MHLLLHCLGLTWRDARRWVLVVIHGKLIFGLPKEVVGTWWRRWWLRIWRWRLVGFHRCGIEPRLILIVKGGRYCCSRCESSIGIRHPWHIRPGHWVRICLAKKSRERHEFHVLFQVLRQRRIEFHILGRNKVNLRKRRRKQKVVFRLVENVIVTPVLRQLAQGDSMTTVFKGLLTADRAAGALEWYHARLGFPIPRWWYLPPRLHYDQGRVHRQWCPPASEWHLWRLECLDARSPPDAGRYVQRGTDRWSYWWGTTRTCQRLISSKRLWWAGRIVSVSDEAKGFCIFALGSMFTLKWVMIELEMPSSLKLATNFCSPSAVATLAAVCLSKSQVSCTKSKYKSGS